MAHHKHKTNRRSFTPRKLRLAQNLASGKFRSNYQAAIAAGYAPGATAKDAARRVLKEMQEFYPETLAELGLTPEAIILNCLVPALNATDRRDFVYKGIIKQGPEHPAWHTRLTAVDMVFKITGAYDDAQRKDAVPTISVTGLPSCQSIERRSDLIETQAKVITDTPVHPPFTSPKKQDPPISSHSPDPDDGTDCC